MWPFVWDIASVPRTCAEEREQRRVDPLAHKVFVQCVTSWLKPCEAERLPSAFTTEGGHRDSQGLSEDG
jgi:hypothetical protein